MTADDGMILMSSKQFVPDFASAWTGDIKVEDAVSYHTGRRPCAREVIQQKQSSKDLVATVEEGLSGQQWCGCLRYHRDLSQLFKFRLTV